MINKSLLHNFSTRPASSKRGHFGSSSPIASRLHGTFPIVVNNHCTLFSLVGYAHKQQSVFDDMIKCVDIIIVQNDFMFTLGCNEDFRILAFLFFMLVKSDLHKLEYTYFPQTQSSCLVFD